MVLLGLSSECMILLAWDAAWGTISGRESVSSVYLRNPKRQSAQIHSYYIPVKLIENTMYFFLSLQCKELTITGILLLKKSVV